jgi:hypothetical protein
MATRLYWHNALFDTTSFPGTYPDANTDTQIIITNPQPSFAQTGADAMTVHRSMNKTIGSSQTTKAITRGGTSGTTQSSWICKFISDPLEGITSITAQTWISNLGIAESSLSSNFGGPHFCLYVWRPSTNALVGGQTIYDASGCGAFAEPSATNSERLRKGNFFAGAGRSISGVQDGDVIIMEVFLRKTAATNSSITDTIYYDGATDHSSTTNDTVVSDIASYIETPQDLTFVTDAPPPPIDMTEVQFATIKDGALRKV